MQQEKYTSYVVGNDSPTYVKLAAFVTKLGYACNRTGMDKASNKSGDEITILSNRILQLALVLPDTCNCVSYGSNKPPNKIKQT
jgi:hypothetical protein